MERTRLQLQQREFRQLHVQGPGLGFREDRANIACAHLASPKYFGEKVDPLAFDPIGKHAGLYVVKASSL
jgi:hypothetical protein